MIGKLRGRVDSFGEDFVILDVGGVGYEVHCGTRLLARLEVGEEASLAIETLVREDMIRLFGFESETERRWFRLLQSVQGVGAKSALAILGVLAPGELATAIAVQDKAMVARAQGVGPKLAQRIVAELRDKAPALTAAGMTLPSGTHVALPTTPGGSAAADAVSALVNLGYQQAQASGAVAAARQKAGDDAPEKELIRLALRELAR
ncbi:MAG: Holliday junction branch migration protein RuvA [Rhizobiales bacterium]|nr:Holliday junction branch migration protein RuvA [Hyphomicrobiales bacterium]